MRVVHYISVHMYHLTNSLCTPDTMCNSNGKMGNIFIYFIFIEPLFNQVRIPLGLHRP